MTPLSPFLSQDNVIRIKLARAQYRRHAWTAANSMFLRMCSFSAAAEGQVAVNFRPVSTGGEMTPLTRLISFKASMGSSAFPRDHAPSTFCMLNLATNDQAVNNYIVCLLQLSHCIGIIMPDLYVL